MSNEFQREWLKA